jgi:two-component system response regulator RegA
MSAILAAILLVDDDEVYRERLATAFRDRGYQAHTAGNYDEAMTVARRHAPDLAVVDLKMPGRSGLEVVRDLVAADPHIEVVMLTGYGSIPTAVDAVKLGAVEYLQKPADADMILAAFDRGPLEEAPRDYEPPSLARSEWEHIQRVMTDCGNNISKAARKLGLHRRTLQRKLGKYPPRS